MSHVCHAHGCTRVVPPRMFACIEHWRMLPVKIQRAIWREYREGQERDKKPSARYLAVQQLAVAHTAFKPNDEQAARDMLPYLEAAYRFRQIAVDSGAGDPLAGLVPDSP